MEFALISGTLEGHRCRSLSVYAVHGEEHGHAIARARLHRSYLGGTRTPSRTTKDPRNFETHPVW
jgi:hypothetical protein